VCNVLGRIMQRAGGFACKVLGGSCKVLGGSRNVLGAFWQGLRLSPLGGRAPAVADK
jgi:hypothetical protein